MRFSIATIANYAEARDGLLFVTGAGVDRIYTVGFPVPLPITAAFMVEIEPGDPSQVELPIEVKVRRTGRRPLQGVKGLVSGQLADPSRRARLPLAVDLRIVALVGPGSYRIDAIIGPLRASFPFDVILIEPPIRS